MPNLSTTRVETRRRQDEALRLRRQGLSLRTIAAQLGYGRGTGTVSRAIAAAARRAEAYDRRINAVGRRFGVEIEFTGITPETAAAALRRAGLEASAERYNHSTRDYWKVIHDASCGYEAVSPILVGEEGIRDMKTAMRALREAGARVTSNCGLHVHHDMGSMTNDQAADFFLQYVRHQDTINRMVPRSRRNGMWCHSWAANAAERAAAAIRGSRHAGATSRYMSINVVPLTTYGTIEIRQHGGTLNGTKAAAWVRLGWALADAVVAGRGVAHPLRAGYDFLDDLAGYGLPSGDVAYLAGRMNGIGAH